MTTIRELLQGKPSEVWSVRPTSTIYEALELMSDKGIGALPVVEDGRVVGIFSERDYARKVILKGRASKSTRIEELMTSPVLYVRPEQTVNDCMALMTEKRVRHLPVLENGKLIGLITIGDIVKQVVVEQEQTIEQLANYITGTH